MMYFIPDAVGCTKADAKRLGLSAVDDGNLAFGPISHGPGGAGGVIVRRSDATGKMRYDADGQVWYPHKDDANPPAVTHWVGWSKDAVPGPGDLGREEGVSGIDAVLADGNTWHCPTARLAMGGTNLPMRLGLDAEGGDTWTVTQQYECLWDMAAEVWEKVIADMGVAEEGDEAKGDLSFERMSEIASACLAVNYHVGQFEVKALGLLTTGGIWKILAILVDFEAFLALAKEHAEGEKKKQADPDVPVVDPGAIDRVSADDG